jgi:hypothetical protein
VNSLGGEQRKALTIKRNPEQSGISLPFAGGEICLQHRALAIDHVVLVPRQHLWLRFEVVI